MGDGQADLGAADPTSTPSTSAFSASTFTCPVCLELMHKPVIASPCAHASCFWCAHKAMNSFSRSACPLCRSRFRHQAAVCAPLHGFIGAAFPEAFAAREAEVLAEEAEGGVASMAVEAGPDPLSPAAWACASPACAPRLAARPTALLCGHVVCAACVPAGRGCPACGRAARAVAAEEGEDETPPRPCALLEEVVRGLFPGPYAARLAEEAAAPAAPPPAAPAPSPPAPPAPRPHVHFGVGCDTCGAFPILGRRFKCADCPEAIGFDVCGDCVAAGAGGGAGRFGQAHRADHALAEVAPVRGLLHILQDANPELSVAEILRLGAMAREESEGEEERGDGNDDGEAAALPDEDGRPARAAVDVEVPEDSPWTQAWEEVARREAAGLFDGPGAAPPEEQEGGGGGDGGGEDGAGGVAGAAGAADEEAAD